LATSRIAYLITIAKPLTRNRFAGGVWVFERKFDGDRQVGVSLRRAAAEARRFEIAFPRHPSTQVADIPLVPQRGLRSLTTDLHRM
jgi:hypothetical protein